MDTHTSNRGGLIKGLLTELGAGFRKVTVSEAVKDWQQKLISSKEAAARSVTETLVRAEAGQTGHPTLAEVVAPISPFPPKDPLPVTVQQIQQETGEQGYPEDIIYQGQLLGANGKAGNGSGSTNGAHWPQLLILFENR